MIESVKVRVPVTTVCCPTCGRQMEHVTQPDPEDGSVVVACRTCKSAYRVTPLALVADAVSYWDHVTSEN